MGPQEHAFRSGVDVLVATPGRLLDHFRMRLRQARRARVSWCSTRPTACSTWASCPTSGACCGTCRRASRRCSSAPRCRRRSRTLAHEMLKNPVTLNLARKAAPAVGITQAVYPVAQDLKTSLLVKLLNSRRDEGGAGLHADQASRQPPRRAARQAEGQRRAHPRQPLAGAAHRRARRASRAGATACSSPPTSRPAASTSRRSATSSTSTCRWCPRTTSTASAARRAPR